LSTDQPDDDTFGNFGGSSAHAMWHEEPEKRVSGAEERFGVSQTQFDEPLPPRGHPWLAWFAILVLIGLQQVSAFFVDDADVQDVLASGGTIIGQIEGRLLIGLHQIGEDLGGDFKREFQQKIETKLTPHQGPIIQRLQAIAVSGELVGAQEALARLEDVALEIEASEHELTKEESQLLETSHLIYQKVADGEDPAKGLEDEKQKLLVAKLGWCGKLMLAPDKLSPLDRREGVVGPAKRFATIMMVGMLLGFLGLIFGFIAGLILLVLFASRLISFGLRRSSRAGNAGASGVYLEAFAIWMATFQVGSLLIGLLPLQKMLIPVLAINMLVALGVGLLWPVVRGIPWSVVRGDLGWHRGEGLFFEPWFGLLGYLASLPLLFVGVLLMLLLMMVVGLYFPPEISTDPFAPLEVPMHPIVSWVAGGNRAILLQVAFLACVLAPFVEETMFRGCLHRYLRDCSKWGGLGFSFLFSVFFNSLIFAAIHPQGPIAIPVLMAIACGLSILREWRGSLIAPMVAHGLNNAVVTTILFGAVW